MVWIESLSWVWGLCGVGWGGVGTSPRSPSSAAMAVTASDSHADITESSEGDVYQLDPPHCECRRSRSFWHCCEFSAPQQVGVQREGEPVNMFDLDLWDPWAFNIMSNSVVCSLLIFPSELFQYLVKERKGLLRMYRARYPDLGMMLCPFSVGKGSWVLRSLLDSWDAPGILTKVSRKARKL